MKPNGLFAYFSALLLVVFAFGLGGCASRTSAPVDVASIPAALLPSATRTLASTQNGDSISRAKSKKAAAKKTAAPSKNQLKL